VKRVFALFENRPGCTGQIDWARRIRQTKFLLLTGQVLGSRVKSDIAARACRSAFDFCRPLPGWLTFFSLKVIFTRKSLQPRTKSSSIQHPCSLRSLQARRRGSLKNRLRSLISIQWKKHNPSKKKIARRAATAELRTTNKFRSCRQLGPIPAGEPRP
jgi:hypothetical protein